MNEATNPVEASDNSQVGPTPLQSNLAIPIDLVLIDDDPLVHAVWKLEAKTFAKTLMCFFDSVSCLRQINEIPKTTPIFVDFSLGNGVLGTDLALNLKNLGFAKIFIFSGFDVLPVPAPAGVKVLCGKDFPRPELLKSIDEFPL